MVENIVVGFTDWLGDSCLEARMSATFQLEYRCPHCSELKDFLIEQFSEIVVRDIDTRAKPLWDHQGMGRSISAQTLRMRPEDVGSHAAPIAETRLCS